jgi:hypothetical protein
VLQRISDHLPLERLAIVEAKDHQESEEHQRNHDRDVEPPVDERKRMIIALPPARQRPLPVVRPRVELGPAILLCRKRVGEIRFLATELLAFTFGLRDLCSQIVQMPLRSFGRPTCSTTTFRALRRRFPNRPA